MQAVVGCISAICCFGAAYGAHTIFPTEPITESDALLSQSTLATNNTLSKEALKTVGKTPRELIDLYMKGQATLEDTAQLITGKSTLQDAVRALETAEKTPENQFLLQAVQSRYKAFAPKDERPSEASPAAVPLVSTPAPPPAAPLA